MRNIRKPLEVNQRKLNRHYDGGHNGDRKKTLHQPCDKE